VATASVEFALNPHALMLDAVVATGYGTQSRRDGDRFSVAITEQDFNRGVISSPEQLLHGRMAGVQVTWPAANPERAPISASGARLRFGQATSRCFRVDGVPLAGGPAEPGGPDYGAGTQSPRNPLAFLNADDIENISVLKDARQQPLRFPGLQRRGLDHHQERDNRTEHDRLLLDERQQRREEARSVIGC